MKVAILIIVVFSRLGLGVQARAEEVTHQQAFALCITQPALQEESLAPTIQAIMQAPHDPAMDAMTMPQMINAAQWEEGNRCADIMTEHPDIFRQMVLYGLGGGDTSGSAWVAFNSECEHKLTASCIEDEVEAAKRMQIENSGPSGQSARSRACFLIMSDGNDSVALESCMDAVGDLHPSNDVVLSCAGSVTEGKTPKQTGSRIAKCFRNGRQ